MRLLRERGREKKGGGRGGRWRGRWRRREENESRERGDRGSEEPEMRANGLQRVQRQVPEACQQNIISQCDDPPALPSGFHPRLKTSIPPQGPQGPLGSSPSGTIQTHPGGALDHPVGRKRFWSLQVFYSHLELAYGWIM